MSEEAASFVAPNRTTAIRLESYRLLAWRLALIVFAVVLIQVLSWVSAIMPTPLAVARGILHLLAEPATYTDFGYTFFEALSGIAIAGTFGVALGVLVGANRTASDFLNPIVVAIYAVPKIVFLPILMIVLGVGIASKIGNAAFHAFFPIMLNTMTGMQAVQPLHRKVMRSMFATRTQSIRHLYLPTIAIFVFAGFRLAMGLAILGAVLAELFQANVGAGHAVMDYYDKGMMPEMVGIVIVMMVLILSINSIMSATERRLSRWRNAE